MANFETYYTFTLTDADGDQAHIRIPSGLTADTATLAALASDIAGFLTALGAPGTITNAKVTRATASFLYEAANPSTGAVSASFVSVQDAARMNFVNSVGGKGILSVPAPISGIFGALPNQNVVDPTTAVSALITWYEGHARSNGALLNVYNGGSKVSRNARKRAQYRVP